MQEDIQTQKLITEIIRQAQEGKHTELKRVETLPEYWHYKQLDNSLMCVIKILQSCAESTFKSYLKDIITGDAKFTVLLAYLQFQDLINYYEKEQDIVQKMIVEYSNYLYSINFFAALFGLPRGT